MAETTTRHVCASSSISSVARRYRAASARLLPPNLCTWHSAEGSGTGRDDGIVELLLGLRAVIRERLPARTRRSEEHTSELQSLMRISYAVFCLKKKNKLNI